jgi:sugar (pentulose or hexulose) kinase
MDILFEKEGVSIDSITGHGGFFKTALVGQKMMASALHTPVATLKSAGEGGAWGIALLASYLINKKDRTLAEFLDQDVFAGAERTIVEATEEEIEGFNAFLKRYKEGLGIERAAVEFLR